LEHTELSNLIDKITETLMSPSVAMKSEDDPYIWLYYRSYKFRVPSKQRMIYILLLGVRLSEVINHELPSMRKPHGKEWQEEA